MWMYDKNRLEVFAKTYDKSIKLYTNGHWIFKLFAWLFHTLTFGALNIKSYLNHTALTIGHMHFYPASMDSYTVESLIPHEATHTRQFRFFGFGIHPILGLPIGTFCYMFMPLPILLSFIRFYMEFQADKNMLRHKIEHHLQANIQAEHIKMITRHAAIQSGEALWSALYFWAIPKSWSVKWYKKMAKEVIDEYKTELG